MSDKVMYTSDHIDKLVSTHVKLRGELRRKGHLHLGQPVHAIGGNMQAARESAEAKADKAAEREDKKAEREAKTALEKQKLQIERSKNTVLPEHEGYCMKCQAKTTATTTGKITHKNGVQAVYGPCATCGTEVHRMVGKTAPKTSKSKAAK